MHFAGLTWSEASKITPRDAVTIAEHIKERRAPADNAPGMPAGGGVPPTMNPYGDVIATRM